MHISIISFRPHLINIWVLLVFLSFNTFGQDKALCAEGYQFYTKLAHPDDTSIFISTDLLNHSSSLYSMSSVNENGSELDCKATSFMFMLLRGDSLLYSHYYRFTGLRSIDTLAEYLQRYQLTDGDVLIFSSIKVRYSGINGYCYAISLPMIKIIDNKKTYPTRMRMNVSKHLKGRSEAIRD